MLSLNKAFKNPSKIYFIDFFNLLFQLILQVFTVQDMDPNMAPYTELILDYLREEKEKKAREKEEDDLVKGFLMLIKVNIDFW